MEGHDCSAPGHSHTHDHGHQAQLAEDEETTAAGRDESLVPYNLTLQWLESNPNSWPTHEKGLLKRISEYCRYEVNLAPELILSTLEKDLAAIKFAGEKLVVNWDAFSAAQRRAQSKLPVALATVVSRVLPLLEAQKKQNKTPQTRKELSDVIATVSQVAFKVPPRSVLDELQTNDFLDVDEKSDLVNYNGNKIMAWRSPSLNKGFGWKSFLFVIFIILIMTPNLLNTLGII